MAKKEEAAMGNPFVLSFGAAPTNFINRDSEYAAIKADFATEKPRSRTYVITGPHGSGKTKIDASVEAEFDTMLREGAYDIVYTELTPTERQILRCVNKGCTTISEISQSLSVHPSYLAVYKDRLIKKGILCKEKGCWKFALPRFQNYLELMSFFE